MKYSNDILNNICTDLSDLTSANPPCLSDDLGTLQEYALNLAFQPSKDDQWRIFGINLIKCAAGARAAYRLGRGHLIEYVNSLPDEHRLHSIGEAVDSFTRSIHQARVAMDIVMHMEAKAAGEKCLKKFVYQSGDGSAEDRLAKLDNRAKHFAEKILKGDISNPTPVWISDTGLVCSKAELTFDEFARLLEELGENITVLTRGRSNMGAA